MIDIYRTRVGFFEIDHHDPGALYPLTSRLIVSTLFQAVLSYVSLLFQLNVQLASRVTILSNAI